MLANNIKQVPLVIIIKIGCGNIHKGSPDQDLDQEVYDSYSPNEVRVETVISNRFSTHFIKGPSYPNGYRNYADERYKLKQIIFQLGNIGAEHYVVADIMTKIIDEIHHGLICAKNNDCFIPQYLDIRGTIQDGDVAICATMPIGGCWYWNDEYSLKNYPLYTLDKQSGNNNSLYWIASNTTDAKPYIELYYNSRINYYGVRLTKSAHKYNSQHHGNFVTYMHTEDKNQNKCIYNSIGKIIDIVGDYAIIRFAKFPDKDYAMYSHFIKDITGFMIAKRYYTEPRLVDAAYNIYTDVVKSDSLIEVVTNKNKDGYNKEDDMDNKLKGTDKAEKLYNLLCSVSGNLYDIQNKLQQAYSIYTEAVSEYLNILKDNGYVVDSKDVEIEDKHELVLIVLDDDIISDNISLKIANIIDKHRLNIFGCPSDAAKPVSRMFVNSTTIYNDKLDNIKFEAIVFVWDDDRPIPDLLYSRAFQLDSKKVCTTSRFNSDYYDFEYNYDNLSYTYNTYTVIKKGN